MGSPPCICAVLLLTRCDTTLGPPLGDGVFRNARRVLENIGDVQHARDLVQTRFDPSHLCVDARITGAPSVLVQRWLLWTFQRQFLSKENQEFCDLRSVEVCVKGTELGQGDQQGQVEPPQFKSQKYWRKPQKELDE